MLVREARAAAADWVHRHAAQIPDFRGAYLVGSTVAMADDAPLPLGSDLDLAIVTGGRELPMKPGKVRHNGVLLEIALRPWWVLADPDAVSEDYHLAHSLRADTIIVDATGELTSLQAAVGSRFTDESWVRRRCANARRKVERGLESIDPAAPWHDQVMTWVFATGVITHVLLVAALRNPTVRLRYLAVRGVLDEFANPAMYPKLLEVLGCQELTPDAVERHVAGVEAAFDAAAGVAATPFHFSSDISADARPIAIDASRELIRRGDHREIVFWLVVTSARCQKVLAFDGTGSAQRYHAEAFDALLEDLGIERSGDLITRAGRCAIVASRGVGGSRVDHRGAPRRASRPLTPSSFRGRLQDDVEVGNVGDEALHQVREDAVLAGDHVEEELVLLTRRPRAFWQRWPARFADRAPSSGAGSRPRGGRSAHRRGRREVGGGRTRCCAAAAAIRFPARRVRRGATRPRRWPRRDRPVGADERSHVPPICFQNPTVVTQKHG